MKIIRVKHCNTCPYVRTKSFTKICSVIGENEEGYGIDVSYFYNKSQPDFCPLEDEEKEAGE